MHTLFFSAELEYNPERSEALSVDDRGSACRLALACHGCQHLCAFPDREPHKVTMVPVPFLASADVGRFCSDRPSVLLG
jgi:hypothetical protein